MKVKRKTIKIKDEIIKKINFKNDSKQTMWDDHNNNPRERLLIFLKVSKNTTLMIINTQ
jgi:ferredoxin